MMKDTDSTKPNNNNYAQQHDAISAGNVASPPNSSQKPAKKKNKPPRKKPAIDNNRNAIAIGNLLKRGISIVEIAKVFDINPDTIYEHFKHDPAYSEIKKNQGLINDLERALYKRAKGYDLVEETREPVKIKTKNGKERTELRVTKIVTKHVPPDTGALCFALSNLRPNEWKNLRHVDQRMQGNFVMEHTTRKSIDARYNRYKHLLESREQKRISVN